MVFGAGGGTARDRRRGSSRLLDTQLSFLLLISRPLSYLPSAFAKVRLSVRETVGLKEESAGLKASEGINSFSKFILTTSNVGLSDPREETKRWCFLFGPLPLYSALQFSPSQQVLIEQLSLGESLLGNIDNPAVMVNTTQTCHWAQKGFFLIL